MDINLKIGSRPDIKDTVNVPGFLSPVVTTIERCSVGELMCFWSNNPGTSDYYLIGVVPEYNVEAIQSFYKLLPTACWKWAEHPKEEEVING